MTTRVCHSKSLVEESERVNVPAVPYKKQREKMDAVPAISKQRRYVVEEREQKLKEYAEECPFNVVEMHDTKIGIISAGSAYMYAKDALGDKFVLETRLYLSLAAEEDQSLCRFRR